MDKDSKRILCFGDSHVWFWSGENAIASQRRRFRGLDILHAGPVTAHNIEAPSARTKGKETFIRYMDQQKENNGTNPYGAVILCMGEIDCRVHAIQQAIRSGTSISQTVSSIVSRYMSFVDWISNTYKMHVIIFGPGGSAPPGEGAFNPDFPTVGSVRERNYAARVFNQLLEEEALKRRGVSFFSIIDQMIDHNDNTLANALYDGCHVSTNFMNVAERRLRRVLVTAGLGHLLPALEPTHIASTPTLKNVALGRLCVPSSRWWDFPVVPFPDYPEENFCFYTEREVRPSIDIDLGTAFVLQSIELFNRRDGYHERARSLSVEIGLSQSSYQDVSPQPPETREFSDRNPCVIDLTSKSGVYRFVRVALRTQDWFHLSTVRILAYSFEP